jgi:hypothetical protein
MDSLLVQFGANKPTITKPVCAKLLKCFAEYLICWLTYLNLAPIRPRLIGTQQKRDGDSFPSKN